MSLGHIIFFKKLYEGGYIVIILISPLSCTVERRSKRWPRPADGQSSECSQQILFCSPEDVGHTAATWDGNLQTYAETTQAFTTWGCTVPAFGNFSWQVRVDGGITAVCQEFFILRDAIAAEFGTKPGTCLLWSSFPHQTDHAPIGILWYSLFSPGMYFAFDLCSWCEIIKLQDFQVKNTYI